jgi:hypothetical protein
MSALNFHTAGRNLPLVIPVQAALQSALQPSVDAGNSVEAICSVPAVRVRVRVRCARELRRFGKKFDERLLPSFWNGKDVNLRDDPGIRVDDRHVSAPHVLRRTAPTS